MPMIWSFTIVIGLITLISVGGIFVLKPTISRWWSGHDNNDQIAFYLSAIGVFYGITLGLLAAGVWQNAMDGDDKVVSESSSVAALYRDASTLPEPTGKILTAKLKEFVTYVIYEGWPMHKKGEVSPKGIKLLTEFQATLYSFEPKTEREKIIMAEAIRQFNRTLELRQQRLTTVNGGMPAIVWATILVGGFIMIAICCMFNIPSLKLHMIFNGFIGIGIGSLIYLILMFDYPYKGAVAVSVAPYQQVYDQLMK
jgi:hypothetical protein